MDEKKQVTEECISLAGRVLAGGNPLDNEQLKIAMVARFANLVQKGGGENRVRLKESETIGAVREVFGVYFENALSLAGHILGEESAEQAEEEAGESVVEAIARATCEKDGVPADEIMPDGNPRWMDRTEFVEFVLRQAASLSGPKTEAKGDGVITEEWCINMAKKEGDS